MSAADRLLGFGSSRSSGSTETDPPALRDGVVTRVDPNGDVWVTPLDGDARHPLGPCKGAHRAQLSNTGTGYVLTRGPIPPRSEVLFTTTSTGVWIVAYQERSSS